MGFILSKTAPLIAITFVGFLARQLGLVLADDRQAIARLVFNVTLPAVIFVSLSRADLSARMLLLMAACGATVPIVLHYVATWFTERAALQRGTAGVVVLSTLISAVMTFLAPFFMTFHGQEGLSRVAAFDLGNSTVGSSYAYYVATRYAEGNPWHWRLAVRRILAVPVFWADILAFGANLTGWLPPGPVMQVLEMIAAANGPLSMLVLGSFIEPRLPQWKPMLLTLGLRMGLGWLIGQFLVRALGFSGLERSVVSVAAATPIGIMPLIYASLFGLDVEFAAATLSTSIVLGVLLTPVLLWAFGSVL